MNSLGLFTDGSLALGRNFLFALKLISITLKDGELVVVLKVKTDRMTLEAIVRECSFSSS